MATRAGGFEANLPDICLDGNLTFVGSAGLPLDFGFDTPGKTFSYMGLGSDGIKHACQQLAAEQAKDNHLGPLKVAL